jgi:hypothetical protein
MLHSSLRPGHASKGNSMLLLASIGWLVRFQNMQVMLIRWSEPLALDGAISATQQGHIYT